MDLSFVGKETAAHTFSYNFRDLALYALGVGAKKEELDYLYEGRGPKALPSFAVVAKFGPLMDLLELAKIDLAMVVHGGERFTMERPFEPRATLVTKAKIRAIYDMRKFASVFVDAESKNERGEVVATTTSNIIVREAGGFGGEPAPREAIPSVPKETAPHFRIEETTTPEQALLYRLSGDYNPLHADPEFARRVGFERGPILHGLCTYGFAVRHMAQGLCDGDAGKIQVFEGQFRRPVWPGDTLVTEGWKLEDGLVAISVSVKERQEQVLAKAWAKLRA